MARVIYYMATEVFKKKKHIVVIGGGREYLSFFRGFGNIQSTLRRLFPWRMTAARPGYYARNLAKSVTV